MFRQFPETPRGSNPKAIGRSWRPVLLKICCALPTSEVWLHLRRDFLGKVGFSYLLCIKTKKHKGFLHLSGGLWYVDVWYVVLVYIYKYIHIFSCLQYVGSFQDQMQELRPNSSFILWTTQLKDHLFQSSNVLNYAAMRGGKEETLSQPTNLCCPIFLTTSTHRDLLLALLLDTFWRSIQDVQKLSLSTKKQEDSVHQLHEYYEDIWYMWLK